MEGVNKDSNQSEGRYARTLAEGNARENFHTSLLQI